MKPLVSVPVKRGQVVNEWIPADDQNTLAGCADFLQRQRDRMKRVQADKTEQAEKVRAIKAGAK